MTKLHPPLLKAVQSGLTSVLANGQPIDKFLLTIRKEKQFGSRDRSFVAEQIYDVVRYHRLFKSVTDAASTRTIPLPWQWVVINLLRKGEEADTSALLSGEHSGLPESWKEQLKNLTDPKVKHSFTDWMWDTGQNAYGSEWPAIASALNEEATVYLRVNTLKHRPVDVLKKLLADGISVESVEGTDALKMLKRDNSLKNHALYRKGGFEFQDLASQQVAALSGVRPGMLVIDACAGAGGKSLHLAALMNNRGKLLVADKHAERMDQLFFRSKRAGVQIIEKSSPIALHDRKGEADVVVLDVPCTATGTLMRKPEIKWRILPQHLDTLMKEQSDILDQHADLVRPGGKLVYATCSIFKEESEFQVRSFLERNPLFSLLQERRFLPHIDHTDGFYIGVLERKAH